MNDRNIVVVDMPGIDSGVEAHNNAILHYVQDGTFFVLVSEVEGAFEKKYKDEMVQNEGKKLDFIILYGTDGKGSEGICGFIGQEAFAPGEASDDHLTGTATVSVQTVPKWIEDDYDVAVTEDENGYPTAITLTKKG